MLMDSAKVAEVERDHLLGLLRKAARGGHADDASPDDSTWTLAAHHEDDASSAAEDDVASFINQQPKSMLPAPVRLLLLQPCYMIGPCPLLAI